MRYLKVAFIVLLWSCSREESRTPVLFTDVTERSGIDFRNDLSYTERLNPYTYRNFYNGAGVAIGDINNDGLLDIFFAGNQVSNRLYLNNGNLTFSDITPTAGVANTGSWSTGVTFVDINADGFLDIYVCKSGDPESPDRSNQLFINNGDLTFTERAAEYGLDIKGLSVQASFFDYDKDGDLDCYLLTNSIKSVGNYDLVVNQRDIPDPLGGGNKFFINDNGKFRDFSGEAGIYRSNIGFGLGITLGDFNNDSWTDIFVSNDFFERDYLYINDQKGAFKESLTDHFRSISMGSMGADFADLNNDAVPELFVTEMLPDSLCRRKTKTLFESWDKYQLNVQNGYFHQFSRNVLQTQVSDGNFAEIGRLAGVAASEWSWGALLFDMDNDGWKDIFIANGIYKDLLDRDYLAFSADASNVRNIIREEEEAIVKLIDLMPSSSFPNYAFRNQRSLRFTDVTRDWGLGVPMFSNGSAYGDLDNDGDLDLVVSNINAPCAIYRNNTDTANFKSLSLALVSRGKNTYCIGSEVAAFSGDRVFFADNFVTRGFQSSVQPTITLGLGDEVKEVDSLIVHWSQGGYTVLRNLPVNKPVRLVREDLVVHPGHPFWKKRPRAVARMTRVNNTIFRHAGSGLNDFNRDRLLPMMYSSETPSMVRGDLNGDGTEDVYIGGGKGQTGVVLDFSRGAIRATFPRALAGYALSEETGGALIDVDNDGDLDLYMACGGRFFPGTSSSLTDRIFLNDGRGGFSESQYPLPFSSFVSTSVVKPIDFDRDGDSDLLIGERFDPFLYGSGGRGFLFENDGQGRFTDVTQKYASSLADAGMITDIEVADINADGWSDVMVVGDWMPLTMLMNDDGSLIDVSARMGLNETEGWWHDIESGDLNRDGRPDFVIGNHGLNSFFKPGDRMYVNDFDGNGAPEQIFCTKVDQKYYPIADKDDFLSQLPSFRKKILYYRDYGKRSIDELIPEPVLRASRLFEVKCLSSTLLLSRGDTYERVELPPEAQYAPVFSILITDFDDDGIDDVLAGGNHYQVKPQFGRYDASSGWFFKGVLREGRFFLERGVDLKVGGQIRDIEVVDTGSARYVVFAKHDDNVEIFKIPD